VSDGWLLGELYFSKPGSLEGTMNTIYKIGGGILAALLLLADSGVVFVDNLTNKLRRLP
jgi:hypothetical protein